jgi:hypothetical protein
MNSALEYSALVTNLLTLTGLEEGRTNAAYLTVDQESFPKEYEDYFNENRQQSGVGVLDLAGCYLSERCQVIIFERVIADLASRLNID